MADERVVKRRLELRVKMTRARLNYLAIGALTLTNILLNLFGLNFEFPFYLSIPYAAYLVGRDCVGNGQMFGVMISLFVFTAAFAALYVWLFIRSMKRERLGGLLGLIIADTLGNLALIAVLLLSAESAVIFTQVLNLAFHLFVLVFAEGGRRAAYGLTVLPTEEEMQENPDADLAGAWAEFSHRDDPADDLKETDAAPTDTDGARSKQGDADRDSASDLSDNSTK